MFIRKKKNSSGSITVLIIEKRNRRNIILKNIGTSTDAVEIDYLYSKGLCCNDKTKKGCWPLTS
jgi:hypothetical protein